MTMINYPSWVKATRDHGWPLCPSCGEDELFASTAVLGVRALATAFEPSDAAVEQLIPYIEKCYGCGWEPPGAALIAVLTGGQQGG